ncbi:MAG TPA: DUF748 domain-containing protein [Chitinophagaceae bacterium]|nr:DUF748 domain-containing protein [Chitinophagaceae bacterium]
MKWNKKRVRAFFRSRKGIVITVIISALIIFRLFLPLIVKNYVNKVLNRIPGYHGHVEDIDIALIRGAYVINGLYLYKNGDEKPMLDLPKTDISIQWGAIFHGRIVSEIEMSRPKFNYYITKNKLSPNQTPGEDDWTAALKKLVPIKINRLRVEDGEFLYADILESPDINLSVKKIDLIATNMGNVVDKSKALPSDIQVHAVSFGEGNLDVKANMDLLKKIPDMDVNLSLTNSNVTALNDVSLAAAGFDFQKGQFNFFSEFAINKGYLKGYFKPMFHDIKLHDTAGQPNSNIFKRVWEGVIGFFGFVLKNKPKDSFATKIPIEGDLNDPNVKVWPLITNIFKNGFISPFKKEVDNDINFSDAKRKKPGG